VTLIARTSLLAIAALVTLPGTVQAGSSCGCQPGASSSTLCKVPVTKSYRMQPGFCPQQLAAMIPQAVSGGCADCCGPQGIPPIYVSGNYVLVRQTPDVHEQVAKFLEEMGAYVPFKPAP
jgi:hypothetical protein